MIITTKADLQTYREAARISTKILDQVRAAVKPGVYPIELDQLAGELCQHYQVKPAFKGVQYLNLRYKHNSCISVNDEILHGIPSDKRALKPGDLIKLDFGIVYKGFFTDQCVTVGINPVSNQDKELLKVGKKAVLSAVELAVAGNTAGDLGYTMHRVARKSGFDVLKQYIGHGIGHSLHENPELPAHGRRMSGETLREGMVMCVEAQVVAGSDEVFIDDNNWTVKTVDGKKGVMFEYMVVVGKEKPETLTHTVDWPITQ